MGEGAENYVSSVREYSGYVYIATTMRVLATTYNNINSQSLGYTKRTRNKQQQNVKARFTFISSCHLKTGSAPLALVHSSDPVSSPIHTLLLGWVAGTVY